MCVLLTRDLVPIVPTSTFLAAGAHPSILSQGGVTTLPQMPSRGGPSYLQAESQ